MAEKLFTIFVKGKEKSWGFDFIAEEEFWQDWLDDGLHVEKKIMEISDKGIELFEE